MKTITGIGVMALTLCVSHLALGAEGEGSTVWDGFSGFLNPNWCEDFSVSVGVKVWMNEWTRDIFVTQGLSFSGEGSVLRAETFDTQPDAVISEDIEPTPIPQLGIRYKWLFLTGSYYTETDFDFETAEGTIGITVEEADGDVFRLDETTIIRRSGQRFEWDVGGGIYVLPHVAILGGYKKVVQDFNNTNTVTNSLAPPTTEPAVIRSLDANIDISGPTVGVAASVPISQGFGFYASYAHGFMDVEFSGDFSGGSALDGDYNVAELGFTYTHGAKHWAPHMPLSAATAYVGYRYQIIETDLNEPVQDRTDITKGFAAGVNLSF